MTGTLDLVPAIETLVSADILQPTRLVLVEDIDFETYERLGWALGQINRASRWWIGDWLLYGEDGTFGDRYVQAVAATGLSEETLRYYLWVCKSIAPSRRLQSVPFSVHATVARLEPQEQKRWLSTARKEGLSQRELKARIREEEILLGAQQGSAATSTKRTPDRQTGSGAKETPGDTRRSPSLADTTPSGLPLSYLVPGPVVRRLVRDAVPGRDGYVKVPRDLIERLAHVIED